MMEGYFEMAKHFIIYRAERLKKREKQKEKSLKDVFIEQYKERMVVFFNCSQKELNFKLALYFQDMNLEDVKKIIKEKQQRFEETNNWDSQ